MDQVTFASRNIIDKLKKGIGDIDTFFFYWQTYIMNQFRSSQANCYIISYPKCGRTWLRMLLIEYFKKFGTSATDKYHKFLLHAPDGKKIKIDHDQGNWVPCPPKINQLKIKKEKFSNKKIIFLVRDPRDVLVSSWYHLKYRENIYKQDLSSFIREDLMGIKKIVAFYNLWIDSKLNDFLLLYYEDMHEDTAQVLKKIIEFNDLEIKNEWLDHAVSESRFSRMKKIEKNGDMKEPWMKPGVKNLANSMKVRKGKIGSYKEEFKLNDVKYLDDYINKNLTEKLKRYKNAS